MYGKRYLYTKNVLLLFSDIYHYSCNRKASPNISIIIFEMGGYHFLTAKSTKKSAWRNYTDFG